MLFVVQRHDVEVVHRVAEERQLLVDLAQRQVPAHLVRLEPEHLLVDGRRFWIEAAALVGLRHDRELTHRLGDLPLAREQLRDLLSNTEILGILADDPRELLQSFLDVVARQLLLSSRQHFRLVYRQTRDPP